MLKHNSNHYILYPVSCILLIVFCVLYSVSCFAAPPRNVYPETEIKRFQSLLDIQLNAGTAQGQMLYWDTTTPSWNATDTPAAADRMPFWDNSATKIDWLTPGNGLTITGTDIDWSASGIAGHDLFSDYVANEHIDWTNASDDLTTTGLGTFGNLDVDTLNLNGNVISDSTGEIELAGTGNTNNEDLTLDFETTANTVIFGTGTGVTKIDFGSFAIDTTGTYTGGKFRSTGATLTNGILAIGDSTTEASGSNSIAMGTNADAVGTNSIAIGASSDAGTGVNAVAIGVLARANSPGSTALGQQAYATNTVATSVGKLAVASGEASTALGYQANATADFSTQIGDATNSTASTMAFGIGGTNYMILSATDLKINAKARIGDTTAPTDALEVTGIKSGVVQTTTLGVGVTTFAITQNIIELTGDGGTNTIATITGASIGTEITIIFRDGNVTITDDNSHAADSIDLSAAFTGADDTVLGLVYNGTSWYEKSRSVN